MNSSSIEGDFCEGEGEISDLRGLSSVDICSCWFLNINQRLIQPSFQDVMFEMQQYNKYIEKLQVPFVSMQPLYRNITITYHKISMDCQVPCTQLVNHYFTQTFRNHHDYFQKYAKQQSMPITPLSELTNYDVRLNSLKPQSTVRFAQLEFGAYNPQKRLVFYIIEEQKLKEIPIEQQQKDQPIEFELLTGGIVERSQSLNIKGKTYEEVEMDLRKAFGIESTQLIQFIHSGGNQIITIQRNQKPYNKFKALRLVKVGVKRMYTAG